MLKVKNIKFINNVCLKKKKSLKNIEYEIKLFLSIIENY